MSTRQSFPGLWTMTKGKFEESVTALEKAIAEQGSNPCDLFDLFRTDNEYVHRIAQAMIRGGFDGSTEAKLVRFLLGNNVFDAADWTTFYNAKLTQKQLRKAGRFPGTIEDIFIPQRQIGKGYALRIPGTAGHQRFAAHGGKVARATSRNGSV